MDVPRVRERPIDNRSILLGTSGSSVATNSWYCFSKGMERCIDYTHRGPPYRTGSPFEVLRTTVTHEVSAVLNTSGVAGRWANTAFCCSYFGNNPVLLSYPTWDTSYVADGTKGWSKFRPGNSKADLGQFLVELRDLPTAPLSRILSAKNAVERLRSAGPEYLNIEFGWKPIVNDLRKIWDLSQNLGKHISQLKRDNGKSVRRKGTIRKTFSDSTTTSSGSVLYPSLTSEFYWSSPLTGSRRVTTRVGENVTFSARFRYFIEDVTSVEWESRATAALFGINPTPSLLWEVLPWSWLIDWAVNVGDVLSNMSANAADNLVADYAFVMGNRFSETEVYEAQFYRENGALAPRYATAKRRIESKVRRKASPYGFGIVPGDLSDRQVLILSALGISRRW